MQFYDIPGHTGYQISKEGIVRTIDRFVTYSNGSVVFYTGKILTKIIDKGYYRVGISINKRSTPRSIHRLLAITFLDNPKNLPQVNHINGIKTDNRLENLEWISSKDNTIHAFKTGLAKSGNKNKLAKLTWEDVENIRKTHDSETNGAYKLAKKYGVSKFCIQCILRFKTWRWNPKDYIKKYD